REHPGYRTPHIAVVAVTACTELLALSGSYEQLFTYVIFASSLLHLIGAFGVFRLRRRRPDLPRPYRVWGYPIVPVVFIVASGAVVVNTLVNRPTESLAGLVFLALGVPFFWYSRRSGAGGAS